MFGQKVSPGGFWVCLMVTTAYIFLCGCGQNPKIRQSIEVWGNYVDAVRVGDSEAAGNHFTPESRPYFGLDSALQSSYKASRFTVVKTELNSSYIRLQILQKTDTGRIAFYEYLVSQQASYRLQYPFLIFADNWPVKTSPHFIIHSRSFALSPVVDDSADGPIIYDPDVFEKYYAKIHSCTGIGYDGTVDYYFCRDKDEAGLLSGQDSTTRAVFGPCIISTEKYDLADITRVIISRQTKPCDLLYYGVLGYGELERARVENAPTDDVNAMTAKYIKKLDMHPLSALLHGSGQAAEQERRRDMFFIGGALVKYLIDTYGEDKFRELYQSATSADEFEKELLMIYNLNLSRIEDQLRHQYQPYLQN